MATFPAIDASELSAMEANAKSLAAGLVAHLDAEGIPAEGRVLSAERLAEITFRVFQPSTERLAIAYAAIATYAVRAAGIRLS